MIYFFHGSDVEKARTKAFEWITKARMKEPNLSYVRLTREDLTHATLEDAALSGGLFVRRLLILIDNPFSSTHEIIDGEEDNKEEVSENIIDGHIENLSASDNAIVILAPRLMPAKAKKLAAKARVEYVYDEPPVRTPLHGFNRNLVNALTIRSREKLWLEINRALRAGDAPEMLHGFLHWKARDLIEKGSPAWEPQESRQLSLALIMLLQDSRNGGLNLASSLERFALSINQKDLCI